MSFIFSFSQILTIFAVPIIFKLILFAILLLCTDIGLDKPAKCIRYLGFIFFKYLKIEFSLSILRFDFVGKYTKYFVLTFFKLANFFWKKGDEKTIDGLGPNGVAWLISKSSNYLSMFQSGYLFHYAFAMLGGLVIILTWFLYY